jgi:hypothetical protein
VVDAGRVPQFMLHHRHEPAECGVVFASFKAFESPLGDVAAVASCSFGGHEIWWQVEAGTKDEALDFLPEYVAERSTATRIKAVLVP